MKQHTHRLIASVVGGMVVALMSPLGMAGAAATPVATPTYETVTQEVDGSATISWSGQATEFSDVMLETGTVLNICAMNGQSCTSTDVVLASLFFQGGETSVTISPDSSTVVTSPSGSLQLQGSGGFVSLPVGYYVAQISQWSGGVETGGNLVGFTLGGQIVVSDTTPTTLESITVTVTNLPPSELFTMSFLPFFQGTTIGGIPVGLAEVVTFDSGGSGSFTWTGDWLADFSLPSSYAGILPGILMVTPSHENPTFDYQIARSEQIFPGKGYGTDGTSFEFSGPGFVDGQLVPGQDVVVVAKGFPAGTEIVGIVAFEVPNSTGDLDTDFWTWYFSNWQNNGSENGNGVWWNLEPDINDPSVLTSLITIPANFTADTKIWTWHASGLLNSNGPNAIARYGYGVVPLDTFLEDVIEVPVAPVAPVWVDPVLPLSDPVIAGQKYAGGSVTCTSPQFEPAASSVEFSWTLNGQLVKTASVSAAPFVNILVLAGDVTEGSVVGCRVTARTSIGSGTVARETTVVAKPVAVPPTAPTCNITATSKTMSAFSAGSTKLSTAAVTALKAKSGSGCTGTYLVSGHSGGKNSAANRRLARMRAQAVVKALAAQHPAATFKVVTGTVSTKSLCSVSSQGRCAVVRVQ